ncbi:SRPBCC family protein [Rhizobium sp. CECT 9324]|jgi:uncharacterized protein YndB with AHSA1/START domain|uniref:SRPBCC family protein n=1 Tax=Rhizobium sp. CECT 9324 TaxID=2845820 RepID=UPI001E422879|nr:SRPBCC family protein [Rhizobium sp. CECT 9324]CAH0341767.1 hypothetical protein RHI9324_03469 [Rhizobium sp. CECT 9324]
MTETATLDAYGVVTEPATLKIERLLPGPVERVWDYLTKSDLRRQWLAAGEMDLQVDAPFELTWRNDELTDPPGVRPEGFSEQHSMQSRITELDPLHKLTFTWGDCGSVTMTLQPKGQDVLLTLVHHRISDRKNMLMVGAGWHMHLDILAARINGRKPQPFWDGWLRLRDEYDQRIGV